MIASLYFLKFIIFDYCIHNRRYIVCKRLMDPVMFAILTCIETGYASWMMLWIPVVPPGPQPCSYVRKDQFGICLAKPDSILYSWMDWSNVSEVPFSNKQQHLLSIEPGTSIA